ncbi:sigma-70 family RNA polymerase sigma factor [Myxococcus llanfairpwllgwyngyllgogerychwyrndrobwllllantysiliogogogochensis]|uniref:Sigma-70 family RNA polymerase sigma factor n=2 Tax=Myxococcus llanfairpwllgwyngyllgogerychwyrndrobwllllantysiliogogogochensis TaxID=2590453 RepID=A0A540X823_9BACT|nr:sigma-70 family RNA polymerase sigma factor [Myxococcus llanfairpwllgwyngyllgogerychwyrndrobwllllantysiliogogogochensis]
MTMNGTDHEVDVSFARACARGDAQALAEFEARYVPQLRKALLHRGMEVSVVDEALQVLRVKLFLPSGDRAPRIADYEGEGTLLAWLRVAALRTALNLMRERRISFDLDDSKLAETSEPEVDADRRFIQEHYREDFAAAFQEALKALEPRSRTLLRLHLVEGLGTAQIARAYQVDRSTVKRWLAQSRERLRDDVRQRLAARLGEDTQGLSSLLRVLQSQLDLSIRSVMRDATPT